MLCDHSLATEQYMFGDFCFAKRWGSKVLVCGSNHGVWTCFSLESYWTVHSHGAVHDPSFTALQQKMILTFCWSNDPAHHFLENEVSEQFLHVNLIWKFPNLHFGTFCKYFPFSCLVEGLVEGIGCVGKVWPLKWKVLNSTFPFGAVCFIIHSTAWL